MKKLLYFLFMLVLMAPILTACSAEYVFPENVWAFFAGYTWEDLLGFVFFILFGLFPGFNLFQWIKVQWGWEGNKAHVAVMGLSVAVTGLCMFLAGIFNVESFEFSLANLIEWASFVYIGSQVAYKRFKSAQLA